MSVNNNGRMLPPETLLIIFGHAESDPNHRPSFFINYQLVHRSWVEAAQMKLYNTVVLNPQDARTFVGTIQNNQNAGRYVRELVFNPGFVILAGLLEMLQTIFNRCPNIQVVYPKERANERLVWTFIAAMENPPRNIRILMPVERMPAEPRLQNVATVACRQTVTQVQLSSTGLNQEARLTDNDPYHLVLQRLPEFPSLNWMYLTACRWDQIDFFVNRCMDTLSGLTLQHLDSLLPGQLNNARAPRANITPPPWY